MTGALSVLMSTKPNIVELLYSSSDLEPAYPAIYCVYSPLALANLQDVVSSHYLNLSAQISLLIEYLQGLAYLHDQKGIMHRDIKPENLAVLSLFPPRGIILDLDSATSEETSYDDQQGTVAYQAPEVINLSFPGTSNRQSYGRSADVWALGMSAFCALMSAHTKWSLFDYGPTRGSYLPGTTHVDFVLETRLKNFHKLIAGRAAINADHAEYVDFLKDMTAYRTNSRVSASRALKIAERLWPIRENPEITPKVQGQGTKRKIGDVG